MARRREKIPLWGVTIAAHTVSASATRLITIPADQRDVFATTERDAKLYAIRRAHREAHVPAWKPCIRESWSYTKAVK